MRFKPTSLLFQAILLRSLGLSLVWWMLAEGRADSWAVGLPSIALALVASLLLSPPDKRPFSWAGCIGFVGFFLLQSIKAGMQVARMALQPRLDLEPALLEFKVSLPEGRARVLLLTTLNLLPGTLSVRIEHDILRMHALDARQSIEEELRMTEARIAQVFVCWT